MSDSWGYGHGFGMLFWLILLIALIWLLVKVFSGREADRSTAENILAERFARGEISEQEYQDKLKLLREDH